MKNSFFSKAVREKGIIYVLIVFWIVLIIANENFRQIDNLLNILRESTFVGVAAIGMTFCIISGHFDLSVGSMLPLLMIIMITIVGSVGLVPAILIVLIMGAILGSFSGMLVALMRLPAFIATLALYNIYSAVALITTNGTSVNFSEEWFTVIGNGDWLGIPIPFIVMILLAILGTLILRRTTLGRHVMAIGNSEKASLNSGINIKKTTILVFVLVGIFTAVSAVLVSSRLWSARYDTKSGFEFEVITAVVLGGTSLNGGRGSVANTIGAAILLSTISTGLNLFNVESYVQNVIRGFILLVAFSMTGIRALMQTRSKEKVVQEKA